MSASPTHSSPILLSSNTSSHPLRTSLLHSGLTSQTGNMMTMFSHTRSMFMFPLKTPSIVPSLLVATIMKLLDTPVISKPVSSLPQSFGGKASHSTCGNTLRTVLCARKTSLTLTPPSPHSPQLGPIPSLTPIKSHAS